ncbi:MAG TPA: hypothetical protein VGP76_06945 [Planctomycetaceae bacterium]|jgi:hypothetical protein|nr:hypothetical protein [Planctomycetaceae bacterium]
MARQKLNQSSQPLLVRSILALYEFFASLKLAVVLILSVAILLGTATFVEANYGTAAVGFLIYHTWGFAALLSLLALNIFCAAAIRFPWKRHQTGFVITHIGLLTLLAGSAISDRGSVNSQMLVYLGDSNQLAIDMDQSILSVSNIPGRAEQLDLRFQPGPFNWSDLAPWPITRRVKSWFGLDDPSQAWQHPPQVVYNDGKTKLEVIDYYSRSTVVGTPYLSLKFYQPRIKVEIPVDVSTPYGKPYATAPIGPMGLGEVVMWQASQADSLTAFKECKPDRSVEGDGMVAFWWKGETTCASVKELQKLKEQKKRFELNDGLTVELGAFSESVDLQSLVHGRGMVAAEPGGEDLGPTVELIVYEKVAGKEEQSKVLRFADLPYMPVAKQPAGFRADFYHPSVKGRVEILVQGDKLAYRAWQKALQRVVASGDLEIGRTVETFSMGGGDAAASAGRGGAAAGLAGTGKSVMEMTALRYVGPGEEGTERIGPNQLIVPQPFDKADRGLSKGARIRLTSTNSSEHTQQDDFWLTQNLPEPWESAKRRQVHRTDFSGDKPILSSLNVRETNVGFALKLINFDLEVDPGTKMASNYTSHLVQVDVRHDPDVERKHERFDEAADPARKQTARVELDDLITSKVDAQLQKLKGKSADEQQKIAEGESDLANLVVTMNRPLDYPDLDGRQLRFFQENYMAPDKERGTPLGSVFRVNYDPGRPVKYLGSGLIVFGIFLMFYMRAYFFKRPAPGAVT